MGAEPKITTVAEDEHSARGLGCGQRKRPRRRLEKERTPPSPAAETRGISAQAHVVPRSHQERSNALHATCPARVYRRRALRMGRCVEGVAACDTRGVDAEARAAYEAPPEAKRVKVRADRRADTNAVDEARIQSIFQKWLGNGC